MKKLIAIILIMASGSGFAQDYKIALPNNAGSKVALAITGGDIRIIGYAGEEVKITTDDVQDYTRPERAAGLKSLYNNTEDNTGIGLSVLKEGNVIKIVKASRRDSDYEIHVPHKATVTIDQVNWGGGDLEVSGMEGELEMKSTNGDMVFKNISGPLVANSTAGDITATFSTIRQGKPTAISLVSGDVDVTLPADVKADFKLQSISGEIYTDFDIAYKKTQQDSSDGLRHIGGGFTIDGTTNGGGTEISIKTISGDIFIRRNK